MTTSAPRLTFREALATASASPGTIAVPPLLALPGLDLFDPALHPVSGVFHLWCACYVSFARALALYDDTSAIGAAAS